MADRAWRTYQEQMKQKRMKTRNKKNVDPSNRTDELVIQQLSAEVSGKAQKYLRVGPREFVAFQFDEVTIPNIKLACEKHFAHRVGNKKSCDVLAGEQGPLCKTMSQIPNTKLIHVRFIPDSSIDVDLSADLKSVSTSASSLPPGLTTIRKREAKSTVNSEAYSSSLPKAKRPCTGGSPSKCYPKSLSVLDMLKLGKIVDKHKTTVIHLYSFDINLMSWSKVPKTVEFFLDPNSLGEGGFRTAYKATSQHAEFKSSSWVIKKYLLTAVSTIEATNLTVVDHNKRVVQMHMLARNFGLQLKEEIMKDPAKTMAYGEHMRYRKIFLGETEEGESVTVEEFVGGSFVKYINNTGLLCVPEDDHFGQKAQCLSHFSFEKSGKKLMVVDIQGSGGNLYDPEVATSDVSDDDQLLFCAGNLVGIAINNFIGHHECNKFCKLAKLSQLL